MADKGLFGGLFDINGDGKLDFFEQAMEFAAISQLMEEEEDDDTSFNNFGTDDFLFEDDSTLADAGLDYDDLLLMDEDELEEALEEAGLDPDDFCF